MQEYALSPAQRVQRREERRAAYVERTSRKLRRQGWKTHKQLQKGRRAPQPRRARSNWFTRTLFKAAAFSAAFAWVALGGADPTLARLVTLQETPAVSEAVAALEQPTMEIALVDTNGDGSIDLARSNLRITSASCCSGSDSQT